MSLDGYADGWDDVSKLGWRGEIWLDFGGFLVVLCKFYSCCVVGAHYPDQLLVRALQNRPTPHIYLVLKYNKLQFTKILKPKKHAI